MLISNTNGYVIIGYGKVADLAAARILKLPRQRALDLERPGFAHSATFIGFIIISIED